MLCNVKHVKSVCRLPDIDNLSSQSFGLDRPAKRSRVSLDIFVVDTVVPIEIANEYSQNLDDASTLKLLRQSLVETDTQTNGKIDFAYELIKPPLHLSPMHFMKQKASIVGFLLQT